MKRIVTIDGRQYDIRQDGVTHINIYSQGKTELGRWLSNFTYKPVLTEDGPMASMEAYYHWLKIHYALEECGRTPADFGGEFEETWATLPRLSRKLAQTAGRTLRGIMLGAGCAVSDVPSEAFTERFTKGLVCKLRESPRQLFQLQMALEDGIPLVHYYVMPNGSPFYRPHFMWLCECIRQAYEQARDT